MEKWYHCTRRCKPSQRSGVLYKAWVAFKKKKAWVAFKAIIKTKVEDPSRSLLKRLCYPETCSFLSTATSLIGGVNMKGKELITF